SVALLSVGPGAALIPKLAAIRAGKDDDARDRTYSLLAAIGTKPAIDELVAASNGRPDVAYHVLDVAQELTSMGRPAVAAKLVDGVDRLVQALPSAGPRPRAFVRAVWAGSLYNLERHDEAVTEAERSE